MSRIVTLYSPDGSTSIDVPSDSVEQLKAQGWTEEQPSAKKPKAKGEEMSNG